MKRLAAVSALLAALGVVAVAQAVVVQNFNFELKDTKPDGRFTVVFSSRSFDDAGGVPDTLTENYIRLPKGSVIRRQFINRKYYCDVKKLVDTLKLSKPPAADLGAFLNQKLRGKKVPPKSSKDLIAVCRFARVGSGTVLVDARPFVDAPIPSKLEMFWTKPTPGAVGTFGIVAIPDRSAAVVRDTPAIRDTYPMVHVDFLNDPTPDGLYDYKLVLPTGPVAGITISVAEVRVTVQGMTLVKKKARCLARRHGKCVKRKVKRSNLFLFTQPTCPPSGKVSFRAHYGYANSPPQERTIELSCPRFKR